MLLNRIFLVYDGSTIVSPHVCAYVSENEVISIIRFVCIRISPNSILVQSKKNSPSNAVKCVIIMLIACVIQEIEYTANLFGFWFLNNKKKCFCEWCDCEVFNCPRVFSFFSHQLEYFVVVLAAVIVVVVLLVLWCLLVVLHLPIADLVIFPWLMLVPVCNFIVCCA